MMYLKLLGPGLTEKNENRWQGRREVYRWQLKYFFWQSYKSARDDFQAVCFTGSILLCGNYITEGLRLLYNTGSNYKLEPLI